MRKHCLLSFSQSQKVYVWLCLPPPSHPVPKSEKEPGVAIYVLLCGTAISAITTLPLVIFSPINFRKEDTFSCFSCCVDKIPDKSNGREGEFVLARSLSAHSPSWWGRHGSKGLRPLVTWHLQSGSREMDGCWYSAPVHEVQGPSPWDGAAFREGLSASTT